MSNDDVLTSIRNERNLEKLRVWLASLESAADHKHEADRQYQDVAAMVKPLLAAVDGENGTGVRFWNGDEEKAAILSKPREELSWDLEKLVPALRALKAFERVSVRVVDPAKLASELASGNLTLPEPLRHYQYVIKDVSPSVRFVNVRPESK
jgi:hypothetical protein